MATPDVFVSGWGGLNRKCHFDVLHDKLGMDVAHQALIAPVISHDEFILINNAIKEYNKMKEEIKNLRTIRP